MQCRPVRKLAWDFKTLYVPTVHDSDSLIDINPEARVIIISKVNYLLFIKNLLCITLLFPLKGLEYRWAIFSLITNI